MPYNWMQLEKMADSDCKTCGGTGKKDQTYICDCVLEKMKVSPSTKEPEIPQEERRPT